jgi:hypothetical protein
MNGQKFTPRLKAGGLWAKTSAKGGRYLTGRLGGVKVLILANKDRQSENDPSHILYFVDGEQRRQGPQERAQDRFAVDPGRLRRHHSPSAAASRGMPVWTMTMRRSGLDECGEVKGQHHAGN